MCSREGGGRARWGPNRDQTGAGLGSDRSRIGTIWGQIRTGWEMSRDRKGARSGSNGHGQASDDRMGLEWLLDAREVRGLRIGSEVIRG